jgi:small subunit ribosomal protein S9
MNSEKTFYATGRRKGAVARVWLFHGEKGINVNGKGLNDYMTRSDLRVLVEQPLTVARLSDQFRIRADVRGGGVAGQAGALRLGISRALLKFDEALRPTLRRAGLLTRDPREKERKKVGHKGARKSFQYTKR